MFLTDFLTSTQLSLMSRKACVGNDGNEAEMPSLSLSSSLIVVFDSIRRIIGFVDVLKGLNRLLQFYK